MQSIRTQLFVTLVAVGMAVPALVAPRAAAGADAGGIQKEMVKSLDDAGSKIIELAEATPENKYAWSPGKDVRTTGQVFMHIVGANYMLPMLFAGKKPPVEGDVRDMEEHPPAKEKLVAMLKESFKYAGDSIAGMSDADMMAPTKLFDGSEGTKGTLMMITVSHAHEHLGQSIAYARSNGIVPPWTARQQAAEKPAGEKK